MKLNQFIPNSPKIQSPRKPVVIAKGNAAQTWRMLDIGKLISGIHNLRILLRPLTNAINTSVLSGKEIIDITQR